MNVHAFLLQKQDAAFAASRAALRALQGTVDTALVPLVKAIPHMKQYLNARFSLTQKDRPHSMKF